MIHATQGEATTPLEVNAAYSSAAGQSIPTSTNTIVDFDTKDFNSHDGSVVVGASWAYTVPVAGKYAIHAQVYYGADAVSYREFSIMKNGVEVAYTARTADTAIGTAMSISRTLQFVAGDTIAIQTFQASGGALGFLTNRNYNFVNITRVGN